MDQEQDEVAQRTTVIALRLEASREGPSPSYAPAPMNWVTTRVVDTSHAPAVRVDSVHDNEQEARATGRTALEVMFVSGERRYPKPGDVLRVYREPSYVFVIAPAV